MSKEVCQLNIEIFDYDNQGLENLSQCYGWFSWEDVASELELMAQQIRNRVK